MRLIVSRFWLVEVGWRRSQRLHQECLDFCGVGRGILCGPSEPWGAGCFDAAFGSRWPPRQALTARVLEVGMPTFVGVFKESARSSEPPLRASTSTSKCGLRVSYKTRNDQKKISHKVSTDTSSRDTGTPLQSRLTDGKLV